MRHCDNWILVNGEPQREPNLLKWARWFEANPEQRIVARTIFGKYEVSTVFLGLDHRFSGDGPPILWETMVFREGGTRGSAVDDGARYSSRADAVAGHDRFVRKYLLTDNGIPDDRVERLHGSTP